MFKSGDQNFPFRQDSHLFALSGMVQESSILVLYPGARKAADREILFILPQDPSHSIWHGKRFTAKQATSISGVQTIRSIRQWDRIMPALIDLTNTIYINSIRQDEGSSVWVPNQNRMAEKISGLYPTHTVLPAYPLLQSLLMIKHPVELDLIKKAIAVTGLAFDRVLHTIKPGVKEYEVEAELTYIISQHGCRHAFDPIIASGAGACTLHYTVNDQLIKKNELVLIDFGAEYAGMNADMTRTIPASGVYTKRQRDIYLSVMNVLDEVTSMMRPGITLKELNKESGKLIESELIRLKILTKRDIRAQNSSSPLWKKYFMHGIGHHLGYDVHDLHDRSVPLKAGMVLTCEPGLYIREEKIGIRLENDILITRGKPKNLMEGIPIHPDDIESIMQQGP
jgi:Xaa-Pro aminopeptidase